MLRAHDVTVSYGSVLAVRGADLVLEPGTITGVVGPNGAGKTSLFSAIAGLVEHGGRIEVGERDVTRLAAEQRAAAGLAFVPDGRRLFGKLTVEQNIRVGAARIRGRREAAAAVARILERFPVLDSLRAHTASTLSGGEGQLLMIARALVASPRVLLVDEPFQGLSADATAVVLDTLRDVAHAGAAVAVATPEPVEGIPSTVFVGGETARAAV